MTTETQTETAAAREPFVYEIREAKFAELSARFDKMVARSKKCKLPAPSFEVVWEADENRPRSTGVADGQGGWVMEDRWTRYVYVTVEGDRPHLAGWDFIATVDHTEADADGAGNVIKSVPGAGEVPVSYRNVRPICEHCGTARNRNETFVVRRTDDPAVTRQIGRNCLADFFPGLSPKDVAQQLAWWVEAVALLGEGDGEGGDGYGGSGGLQRYGLESLLLTTQACIEAFGWTSKTKARESMTTATADYATLPYKRPSDLSGQDKADLETIAEHRDDEKNAPVVAAALEWVRALDPETAEDYLYNLSVVCRGETVRADRLGLACSLLPAYRRQVEGERVRLEQAANPSSHVGAVGVRALFSGCLLKTVSEPYATDFGTSTRLTFTQGPDVLVWWASNADGFDAGTTYDLVATPKKHDAYTNHKTGTTTLQTVVNRVAVATDKDRAKAAKAAAKAAKAAAA